MGFIDAQGRKDAMRFRANSYKLSFWDKGNPKGLPTRFTISFPDEASEKKFKEEMIAKRDRMSKEMASIRWKTILWVFGGSERGVESRIKKKGYKLENAKADAVRFQELYWAKEVRQSVENNGGTFTRV